ncbi:hypothetical protein [Sulfuricurvum sp.]|uniref:hypothetical protein n=1 Tax=Sulfuricurvum sp. TaxID=2025608 RepID=UPI002608184A|nr:hypothetical protein [Sulfuricurvum sp.]MDD2266305.1 hypothetical protein [Sulfuricurvum sp.]MDD2785096.1 hypothetical protein [Sulfuricurvum sp.]
MSITITSDYMTTAYASNSLQSASTSSEVAVDTQSATGSIHIDSVRISTAGKAAAGGGATQTSSTSDTQTEIQKIEKMITKIQQEIATLMQKNDESSKQLIATKMTQLAAYEAELMVLSTQNISTAK